MSTAIIYTKDFCPYCVHAKALLADKGVSYEEINIDHVADRNEVLETIKSMTSMRTFPQIVLDGKHVGGYTDLCEHYARS